MARNLIMGAIEGYQFDQIAPFFLTLRKVRYEGDVVIFSRGADGVTAERLQEFGVRLIELPPKGLKNPITGRRHSGQGVFGDILSLWLRGLASMPVSTRRREGWVLGVAQRFFHIANLRFLLAERYLRDHADVYGHVMITDVRDVIFQADPFDFEGVDGLVTFLEGPEYTVETCKNYRAWIDAAFGAGEVADYRGAPLSCCAITIGTAREMLGYCGAMARLIRGNCTREPYLFGLDSAAHNHLCFHRELPRMALGENLAGPVAHLGAIKAGDIRCNEEGMLLNKRGGVVNIVHQYDRHPSLCVRA